MEKEKKRMTEAKTPKDFFEKLLPSRFKPEKAVGIEVTVQVKISGPDGGDWVVRIRDQKLESKEGIHSSPTLEFKMAEADFMDLINGKMGGEKAFMTGKLKFKGNIGLALKLRETGFI
jgi:putative sterol carrier protein